MWIWIILALVVQIVAPTYISALIAIISIFAPDSIPVIDEVLCVAVALGKLKSDS